MQGVPPFGEHRLEDWLDTLLEEGCNFVATDTDERVVGHALYTPTDAAEPELAVFVHQDAQDRGIGTELCRHVIATAAASDRDALVLNVEPSNRAAISVYESIGFRRDEESAVGEDAVGRIRSFRMRHPLSQVDATDVQRPPALRG